VVLLPVSLAVHVNIGLGRQWWKNNLGLLQKELYNMIALMPTLSQCSLLIGCGKEVRQPEKNACVIARVVSTRYSYLKNLSLKKNQALPTTYRKDKKGKVSSMLRYSQRGFEPKAEVALF